MSFQQPAAFRINRIPREQIEVVGLSIFADVFRFGPACEVAHVIALAADGTDIPGADFEIIFFERCALIATRSNQCDVTFASSIEDAARRYLGLGDDGMEDSPRVRSPNAVEPGDKRDTRTSLSRTLR